MIIFVWLDSGITQIELTEVFHAVDQHTLQFTFDLLNAMSSNLIREHEAPLPARKYLLPEVVATWSRGKGPIDVYSHLKHIESYHSHLGPVGAIWLRLIITSALYNNSSQAYNPLCWTERFLKSDECNSFRNFQHFRKRFLPFRQFFHLLANNLKWTCPPPPLRAIVKIQRREVRQH